MTAFALGLVVSIDRTREFATAFVDSEASKDEELIALRALRDSEIEAKPTFADRAGLWGASVMHAVRSPAQQLASNSSR